MIKLTDLIDDEAAFAALVAGLLCNHFCVGGRACMATPKTDECFCQESGAIIAEAMHHYQQGNPAAATVCELTRMPEAARPLKQMG